MASLLSTKTSLFAFESHLLTGRYVTSYPNLFTVKFLILTFSRFENHFSIITLFFSFFNIFLPQFPLVLCKQLNLPNLSTSSNSHFGPLLKVPFSQKFQFYTSWQLYLATQLFWLTLHVPPQTNIVTILAQQRHIVKKLFLFIIWSNNWTTIIFFFHHNLQLYLIVSIIHKAYYFINNNF